MSTGKNRQNNRGKGDSENTQRKLYQAVSIVNQLTLPVTRNEASRVSSSRLIWDTDEPAMPGTISRRYSARPGGSSPSAAAAADGSAPAPAKGTVTVRTRPPERPRTGKHWFLQRRRHEQRRGDQYDV